MFKVVIKPLAEQDALNAAKWYNEVRIGLGDEFLLALDAKINAIQRNPNQFKLVYKGVRRALTERFPFGIFYIIEIDKIYIIAIVHTRRNPLFWKKRKK